MIRFFSSITTLYDQELTVYLVLCRNSDNYLPNTNFIHP